MKGTTKAAVGALAAALAIGIAPAAAERQKQARPNNDDLAAAEVVVETPFTDEANLRGAGLELGEPRSSCGKIRSSVWYQFTPVDDAQLITEVSSTFNSIVAVYSDAAPDGLAQVACDGSSTSPDLEFNALAGKTYLIQLGSTTKKGGTADIKMSTTSWREKTITSFSQPVEVSDTGTAQVSIHGRPRANDETMYDLAVTAAGQPTIKRGILTFGLVQQNIDLDLVRIPRQHVQVDVTLGYRYDSSQYSCISDGGDGQGCSAKSPVKDLTWLTSGDGSRAELIVKVKVSKDEKALAERTVTIPFAGQVVGMP